MFVPDSLYKLETCPVCICLYAVAAVRVFACVCRTRRWKRVSCCHPHQLRWGKRSTQYTQRNGALRQGFPFHLRMQNLKGVSLFGQARTDKHERSIVCSKKDSSLSRANQDEPLNFKKPGHELSLSLSLSLFLSHTHTRTHTHSHTHARALSLSLSLSLVYTHAHIHRLYLVKSAWRPSPYFSLSLS